MSYHNKLKLVNCFYQLWNNYL